MQKYKISIKSKKYTISVKEFTPEKTMLEIDGKLFEVKLDGVEGGGPPPRKLQASKPLPSVPSPGPESRPKTGGTKGSVTAPIPGSILEIKVTQGDKISAGQPLLKMEAMKMENEISSPFAGTVSTINVHVGDSVGQGQELMVIAEE